MPILSKTPFSRAFPNFWRAVYTVCVYLYIHNKYTPYTQILCKQKLILDAINRLTALIKM